MSRPMPLHGEAANVLIDYELWRRDALRNRVIEPHEAMAGMTILERLAAVAVPMVETMEHISTCVQGSHGVRSPRSLRSMRVILKRPVALHGYRHESPEAA